jgi:hypothetical protein
MQDQQPWSGSLEMLSTVASGVGGDSKGPTAAVRTCGVGVSSHAQHHNCKDASSWHMQAKEARVLALKAPSGFLMIVIKKPCLFLSPEYVLAMDKAALDTFFESAFLSQFQQTPAFPPDSLN